jgi:hypothetical protein
MMVDIADYTRKSEGYGTWEGSINVNFGDAECARLMGDLADKLRQFPKGLEGAIKKGLAFTGRDTRKEAIDILNERYHAKKGDIGKKIKLYYVDKKHLNLYGRGYTMLLDKYKWSKNMMADKYGRKHMAVKAAVLRENQPKYSKSGRGLFFATVGKNKTDAEGNPAPVLQDLILTRESPTDPLPVEPARGPSMIRFLENETQMALLMAKAKEIFIKQIKRGADRELRRLTFGKAAKAAKG